MNPMLDDQQDEPEKLPKKGKSYLLDQKNKKQVEPINNPAAELVRKKINTLYEKEPSAKEEIEEVRHEAPKARSKHQQFMYELSTSGKPLAEIQQAWHDYYASLPDHEKHEVWREFYEANAKKQPSAYTQTAQKQQEEQKPPEQETTKPTPKPHVIASQHFPQHQHQEPAKNKTKSKSVNKARQQLRKVVKERSQAQKKARQHLRSLAFGLGFGLLSIVIVLFGFFNEIVIARLVQPGGNETPTPIILDTDAVAPSDEPQLIIPKINVQLPLVYDLPSSQEEVVQEALDDGIIQYPNTSLPGQKGNGAYFGHSSNNIFNPGQYKFAFALLKDLVPGDIFYITYEGTVYTYQVYDKRIVAPDETWVLGNAPGKLATTTLITCDPPGTTINRLVVWGEQINPDPTENSNAPTPTSSQPEELPAQGPTLWGRFWNWITGSE